MSATTERDLAMRAARIDFARALGLARGVSESWFRAQALAHVARFAPDESVVRIADEAITAAHQDAELPKRAAAMAWPLRALIERNHEQKALRRLPDVLTLAALVSNPVSQSDALFGLWEASFPIRAHNPVFGALVRSCRGHWKADYLLRQVVLLLAWEDTEKARRLAESMPVGKYKRQALKRLAEGQKFQPRSFF